MRCRLLLTTSSGPFAAPRAILHHRSFSTHHHPSPLAATAMSSSTATIEDPFGHPGQAEGYARFRPRYPPSLINKLVTTAKERGCEQGVLVDICTGTGVLLAQIAGHFKQALGFDRSASQLSAATPGPNIEYKEADAYQIPLEDGSVDVITIAQGIHWLDIPRFGAECDRLLKKPHGVMVALGYSYSRLENQEAHQAFLEWYDSLEAYWECDRHLLDSALRGADFGPLRESGREEVVEDRELSMDQYIGYLRTWSAYNTWRAKGKGEGEEDSVDVLRARLEGILGKGAVVNVKTPFFAVYVERT